MKTLKKIGLILAILIGFAAGLLLEPEYKTEAGKEKILKFKCLEDMTSSRLTP